MVMPHAGRPASLLLAAILCLGLAGCAVEPKAVVSASASIPARITAKVASVATAPVSPDAFGLLRGEGQRVVPSAEPAKSTAAAAIRTAEAQAIVDSSTVVTVAEARVSDATTHNQLVWVVGLAPVLQHWHGPPGHAGIHPGRDAVLIDANTGRWIGTFGR